MEKKLSLSASFFRHITRTVPFTPLHCLLSINEYQIETPLHSVLSARAKHFISPDALQHRAFTQIFNKARFEELSPEDQEFIKEYLSKSEYPRRRHLHYRRQLPQVAALKRRANRRRSARRSEYSREARKAPPLELFKEALALNP